MTRRLQPITELTPRMLEILRHIGNGCSHGEAAALMGISRFTANHEVTEIYARLGVCNRVEALVAAGILARPSRRPDACGWLARCTRREGHRGQHGGFRP